MIDNQHSNLKPKKSRMIVAVVNKFRVGDQPKERQFWLSKTPKERLAALEKIRAAHH